MTGDKSQNYRIPELSESRNDGLIPSPIKSSFLEYAKWIEGKTGLILLAQIRSASPIRRDNAYL